MKGTYLIGTALLAGIGGFSTQSPVMAAEWEEHTSFYEDDSWLDVTEWFDGNDYNPTDEAWWRWDDEAYDATEDAAAGGDLDSDYGYTTRDDNDWFYDYYNPGAYSYNDYNDDDQYEFSYQYFDYDRDGTYDAYASYGDWDGDGIYEDYDYFALDSKTGTQQQKQQAQQQAPTDSKPHTVTGKIQNVKEVQVRGQKHKVVNIQSQSGAAMVADLGRTSELKNLNLKEGDTITVKGPKLKVGDKSVVLAKSLQSQGKTTQINRQGRQMQGKVLSTHKTTVRGNEHLIAMVDAKRQGADKRNKVAVDLGPADKLKTDVSEGKTITFTGVPVKVQDRRMVLAQSVVQGDQVVQIDRRSAQQGEAQPASGSN